MRRSLEVLSQSGCLLQVLRFRPLLIPDYGDFAPLVSTLLSLGYSAVASRRYRPLDGLSITITRPTLLAMAVKVSCKLSTTALWMKDLLRLG